MNKRYYRIVLVVLILIIIILFSTLLCKYYLFTDDTARFHSCLQQADGIRVLIFENGVAKINTEILHTEDELYIEILDIFKAVKLRPSFKPIIEKMLTGNTYMEGSTNTDVSMYITLYQNSQVLHSIFLGGNNKMYFDKKAFFMGDFSNKSEQQIMKELYAALKE